MQIVVGALATLVLLTTGPAYGQGTVADTAARRDAMARLAFLVGDWEGIAWHQTPTQRDSLWQTERVRYKLRGQILLIEGLGRRWTGTATPGDTAFNAVAIVDWLPERSYAMRSHTLDGREGTFPIEVSDSGFGWGVEFPGGRIRYTMRLTPAGEWSERGEFSRDGERWFPTFEMLLRRTGR
jgi:hypothetical protein